MKDHRYFISSYEGISFSFLFAYNKRWITISQFPRFPKKIEIANIIYFYQLNYFYLYYYITSFVYKINYELPLTSFGIWQWQIDRKQK